MSLTAGTRLGPYEIQAAIGAGGMGEVYKARDTRLDRTVALKVLPQTVADDSERRARFEREARTIAGLNHPHICTLHDVGRENGTDFLVMEYVAGETLAERLRKGALPLHEALAIATHIAEALAAAHRQGIVHRDLKPGNVMLTKAGAKLLDFGLAKLNAQEAPLAASITVSVLTRAPATAAGTLLGTVPYMAPEQLEGKDADARSDIFAFGAVLYEMLTGKRAFEGESHASVIAAILEREPPALAALQPLAPPALDRLVRHCLAKSPDDRPDTAHDVATHLRWMREASDGDPLTKHRRRRNGLRPAFLAGGVLALALAGAAVTWLARPLSPRPSVAHVSLDVSPAEELNAGGFRALLGGQFPIPTRGGTHTALTWTPDGRALVFVGRRGGTQQLYVRRLDSAEARPLAGTEDARVPAMSPDGQWVAFWVNGKVRKVPLAGGPAMDLAAVPLPPTGLVFDGGGRLLLGKGTAGIWAIPPSGAATALTSVGDAEVGHILPWPLPGDRAFLYTVRKRQWSWGDDEIVAQTVATGARKLLLRDAADARYASSGHLLFMRRGVLFAVLFDADRLEIRGTPVPVLEGVAQALTGRHGYYVTGAGQFAVASTGALAWIPSPVVLHPDASLVAVDRRGHVAALGAPPRSYRGSGPRLSPDGRRLVVSVATLTEVGLWLYDLDSGRLTVLAGGGDATWPVWSADGQRVMFTWCADGRRTLAWQPVDGTATPHVLTNGGLLYPASATPDGRQLVAVTSPEYNIVVVPLENGQGRVQPLIETPHNEGWPAVSPDGRYLTYASDVSGRLEVYVRPFAGPGAGEQVSMEGGSNPAWNPNGRELFFVTLSDDAGTYRMMAVDFVPGSPQRIGRPRPLFEFNNKDNLSLTSIPARGYDVARDGQRFYAIQTKNEPPMPPVTHVSLIENWFDELKAKVPPGR